MIDDLLSNVLDSTYPEKNDTESNCSYLFKSLQEAKMDLS